MVPEAGSEAPVLPERISSVHIVGIGGAGMSAIAMVLAERGVRVTGSDLKASAAYERLAGYGVELHLGHSADNVGEVDAVVISSAIRPENPEVRRAHELGIPVVDRRGFFPRLLEGYRVIGVAGTHGKTTSTSMLTLALLAGGGNPSYIIGGELNEVGTSAAHGSGPWFVVEADESDRSFLALGAYGALVTNVEPDHLESYGGYTELVAAFHDFVERAAGPKVIGTYLGAHRDLAGIDGVITFGEGDTDDYRVESLVDSEGETSFDLRCPGGSLTHVALAVPGRHNCLNAAGAIAMADQLGVPPEVAASAIGRFGGVARRYQRRGERAGVSYVDDYAHLPSELAAVVATTRAQYPGRRMVAVFQPHRYSRTRALHREFADALSAADLVVITDVYAAGEDQLPGVSGELIASSLSQRHPEVDSLYHPSRSDLAEFCLAIVRPGDVVVSMGAGDITALAAEMLELGRQREGAL